MKLVAAISLIFAATVSHSSYAQAFGTETHGGDSVAQEFTFFGNRLDRIMPYLQTNILDANQLRLLKQAFSITTVSSVDRLVLDGQEVDAINTPSARHIDVSRNRWTTNGPDRDRLHTALALHEYLWIAGVDDSNYQISKLLQPDFTAAQNRWSKTPIARGLRNSLCIGVVTRDHSTIDQALQMGADLDGDCGEVVYTCPNSQTSETYYDANSYGPVGLSIQELGPENLCHFPQSANPNDDVEMLQIIKQLLTYHPDLRRPIIPFHDVNGMAISKPSLMILDILVKAGSDPRTALLGESIWNPNGPMTTPEFLLEDIVNAGFDFNAPFSPDYDPNLLASVQLLQGHNARLDFVDFLVKNHKIDFCKLSTNALGRPTVYTQPVGLFVADEYLAIARKYSDPCVR